ncbi:MAG: ankyrin repeat domain-containing protein, partial [Acidobacteriota bacterium]
GNDVQEVRRLLHNGVDVNQFAEPEKRTPLMEASFHSSPEMLAILIDSGASISALDYHGRSALHYAARTERCENIDLLIGSGMLVNPEGTSDFTPLMEASRVGGPVAAKCLLKHGANVNAQDGGEFTPLMHAVWSHSVDTIKVLLEAEPNLQLRNNQGWTAGEIARSLGQDEIARLLNRPE